MIGKSIECQYDDIDGITPIHKALARSLQAGLHQNLSHLARESYIYLLKNLAYCKRSGLNLTRPCSNHASLGAMQDMNSTQSCMQEPYKSLTRFAAGILQDLQGNLAMYIHSLLLW